MIDNSSWIIGRIVRDFDKWSAEATKEKLAEILNQRWREIKRQDPNANRPTRAGLVVSIYKPSADAQAGNQNLTLFTGAAFR